MKERMEFSIDDDGNVTVLYEDGVDDFLEGVGRLESIQRLSTVEWEDGGWVVRSAHDPGMCICKCQGEALVARCLHPEKYEKRQAALDEEVRLFFQFLEVRDGSRH